MASFAVSVATLLHVRDQRPEKDHEERTGVRAEAVPQDTER
ncbi:MAG TPA: hypothetical protein VFA96_07535 [Nocardioides sp.]|nr:hypothetical protein [Nocardioides sp.]